MSAHPAANVTTPPAARKAAYNHAIGYLRAFVVLLVIAHHTALAYLPIAPRPSATLLMQPRTWLAIPVVDTARSFAALLFVGFNDIFFMSLMFFLSGLFFWHGLERKGLVTFLRDRLFRLGLPLAVSLLLFSAVAYYPSYLQTTAHAGFTDFRRQWLALGFFPTGPAWFVAVLFVFDCVAAVLFTLLPFLNSALRQFIARISGTPLLFFVTLVALSAILYVPMALAFTPFAWATWGPIAFQTSRILHYFLYFVLAIGVGSVGLDRGLFTGEGKLARQWIPWSVAAAVAFAATSTLPRIASAPAGKTFAISLLADLSWTLSCAASSFAFLALFLRFVRTPHAWADSLAQNSYAIYLVHYMFVGWLQYAMLPAALPALAKLFSVFAGASALSWLTALLLRRIPGVARII